MPHAVTCTKAKLTRIQYVKFFVFAFALFLGKLSQIVYPLWIGGLSIESSEGTLGPYLALVRLLLLLPSKMMDNATAGSSG
jgi:hypothetical protein